MSLISIFLDSGSHSLYNKFARGKGSIMNKDSSYADTDEFWQYVEKYAAWLKINQSRFSVAVSVDVIFDPERTWKVQRYLEDKHGLKVMPVYHFGEDIKWLKLYMDNYEYIGVGGLGQEVPRQAFIRHGDKVFKQLCDSKGQPKWKVHGFAITSPELILRYPWASTDSTSWLVGERYGLVVIPKIDKGKPNYRMPPSMISMTSRPSLKRNNFRNLASVYQRYILNYCKEIAGVDYGVSEFVTVKPGSKLEPNEFWTDRVNLQIERVIEPGISNDMQIRNTLNIKYFVELEKVLTQKPVVFKPEFSGL